MLCGDEPNQHGSDELVLRHPLDAEQLATGIEAASKTPVVAEGIRAADEHFYEPQAPAAAGPTQSWREALSDAFLERTRQTRAALLGVTAVERFSSNAKKIGKSSQISARSLRYSAWKKLTTAELNQACANTPARPYWHLRWLYALLKSDGRLAPHFDCGGTYRLTEQVFVEPGFRSHGTVAAVMDRPLRLNEILALAKVETVFDLINAYDAVGRIEWTPRQRLNTRPIVEDKQKSLSNKPRWPFDRG